MSGIRDFNLTLGSKIVTLVVAIGTQSCLAWLLGPEGRGSYAVCIVFATLLNIIFAIGCDIASLYFVSSGRFSISEGITHALIYGGIASVLAITAGWILMQLPLSFLDKADPTAFCLALALIPSSLFSLLFINLLTSVQRFDWFAIMLVVHGLGQLLFTIIFVWVFPWGVNGALLANIIRGLIVILSILFFFRWKYNLILVRPSIKTLWEMFHYGARYYAGKISGIMNFQVGTIMLAFFATKEDVGLFAVASQITVQAMVIPDALTTVLIPKVAGNKEGKRELVAQCARLTGLICGMLLLILAVFAKPIVVILFSHAFLPAVPLIQILAVGVLIRCACKVFVPYLLGVDRPGIVSVSTAIGTIVTLVVLWLLLPVIGLPGAAIGTVTGSIISSTLLTIGFIQLSGLGVWEVWKLKWSDWMMVVNVASGVRQKILSNYR